MTYKVTSGGDTWDRNTRNGSLMLAENLCNRSQGQVEVRDETGGLVAVAVYKDGKAEVLTCTNG